VENIISMENKKFHNLAVVLKKYLAWNSFIIVVKECATWWWMVLEFCDAFQMLKNMQVLFKTRNGAKYLVKFHYIHIPTIYEIYIMGVYNRGLQNITTGGVVIDIGAHIGIFSALAAKTARNVRVYAYEPARNNYRTLLKNMELSGLSSTVTAYNLAVYGRKGKVTIFNDLSTGHSITFNQYGKYSEEIEAVTLADIFESNGIAACDLLKIDCEGAEFDILGAAGADTFGKIKNIIMEYHITEEEFSKAKDKKIIDLKKMLEGFGFIADMETPVLFWGLYAGHLYAHKMI